MNTLRTLVGAALVFFSALHAQPPEPAWDTARFEQQLEQLSVLGSVLYVAAHPDDENTQLLAWLSQQRHYRTGYLSLTRGDGGQNLLGSENGESLGLIRTQELLEARRVDGATQFFSRANDFGFSKTADETLQTWDKRSVLADMVWVIRTFQPDVIITRFPGDSRAGHGHHQASALLAKEAFRAAADPLQFPEQLDKVTVWQAKRLMWNTWRSFLGSGDTTQPSQLKVDIGGYNPRLGRSYGEIAASSRDAHKSQGFGSAAQRGRQWEHFALLDGEPASHDLFDGVNSQWSRLGVSTGATARTGAGANVNAQIERLRKAYRSDRPWASLAALATLRDTLKRLPASLWVQRKQSEVDALLLAAAGVWVESYAPQAEYAQGDNLQVRTELLLRNPTDVKLLAVNGAAQPLTLKQDMPQTVSSPLHLERLSQPYWLASSHGPGLFNVARQQLIGEPLNSDAPQVDITLLIAGQTLTVSRPVLFKSVDPIRGEVYRPLLVSPQVTANLDSPVYLFPDTRPRPVNVHLQAFAEQVQGVVEPRVAEGWTLTPERQPFTLNKRGATLDIEFLLTPPAAAQSSQLEVRITTGEQTLDRALTRINYPHIAQGAWFPLAAGKLVRLEAQTADKRIGYIPGAGDTVPSVLRQLGYAVDELDGQALRDADLSVYSAIVCGVRAYNVNPDLQAAQPRLQRYMQNGGVLLVQYNTLASRPEQALGPYPFRISRDRVTEEDAPVDILLPEHPLLNRPNRIVAADFEGWVQERGLYFASDIDPRYQTLLSMHDRNEPPSRGALIVADVGQGRFIYAPLAFFRQLPAGVPGAIRLMANLLSR